MSFFSSRVPVISIKLMLLPAKGNQILAGGVPMTGLLQIVLASMRSLFFFAFNVLRSAQKKGNKLED